MRRLALPTATLIAFTGLAVVAGQPQTAQAADAYSPPTTEDCLATDPFPQSMALSTRNAFFYAEREEDGSVQYYRGVGTEDRSAIAQVNSPANTMGGGQLLAQTAAQLTGWGRESIVRANGLSGGLPTLTIDQYLVGDPSQSPLYQTVAKDTGLPGADSIALAADNFRPSTPTEWEDTSNQYVDPDEVAVAWRSPDRSGQETISVQLFRATLGGSGPTGLVPYGQRWTISGDYDRSGGSRESMLAMTTGDLDLDGDPEIVLTYSWGGSDHSQKVAVLNISNPSDPVMSPAATGTYATASTGSLRQLAVAVGHFGPNDTDIVLGSVADAGGEFSDNPPKNAYVRLVGLPHDANARPSQLGVSPTPIALPTGNLKAFATPATNGNATTLALAVGDIDPSKAASGDLSGYEMGADEVVFAYADRNLRPFPDVPDAGYPAVALEVDRVDTDTQTLAPKRTYAVSADLDAHYARSMALGVGDMDADGDDDVLLMYANRLGAHRALWYAQDASGQLSPPTKASPSLSSATGEPGPIVMADVGNLATRMVQRRGTGFPYTGVACRDTSVATLVDVADAAPSWQTAGQEAFAGSTYVGHTRSDSASSDTTTTKTVGRSYTVSAGFDLDATLFGTSTTVELERGWETSDSTSVGREYGIELESGLENDGRVTAGKMSLVDYRCYYYDLINRSGPTPIAQTRACVPIDKTASPGSPAFFTPQPTIRTTNSGSWETNGTTGVDTDSYSWTPFRDEWSNLALAQPPSSTTISGVSGVSGRAIDANKDPVVASAVAASAFVKNPWWQVTLDGKKDIGLVRVFPGRLDLCKTTTPCEDVLHDFDVYVFDQDALASASMETLKAEAAKVGSRVTSFHVTGIPAKVANVVTRVGATHASVTGKYVRVQTTAPAAYLQLAEVQVFRADDTLLPTDYPKAVRQATPAETAGLSDKNVFVASVWDPSKQAYVDRLMSGELFAMSPEPTAIGVGTGTCDTNVQSRWTSSSTTTTTRTHSTSTTQGVGVESDVAVGPEVLQVKGGAGYRDTSGTEHADASGVSIGKSFTIGWSRSDLCKKDADGNQLNGYKTSDACLYNIKPFYYISEETAKTGYPQQFTHVSYTVTFPNGRDKDMTDCVTNHWRHGDNIPPQASDTAVGACGPILIDPSTLGATDTNPEDMGYLSIMGVGAGSSSATGASLRTAAGGTATVADGKVTYQPPSVAWTQDSFYASVTDHYYLQGTDDHLGAVSAVSVKVTVFNTSTYPTGATNGGFDSALTGWTSTGFPAWTSGGTDGAPAAGPFASMTVPGGGGASTLTQTFLVPTTGTGTLTVWRRVTPQSGASSCNGVLIAPIDALAVSVTPAGSGAKSLDNVTNRDALLCAWKKAQYDLSAYKGRPVTLTFTAGGGADGYPTKFDIDGVSLS